MCTNCDNIFFCLDNVVPHVTLEMETDFQEGVLSYTKYKGTTQKRKRQSKYEYFYFFPEFLYRYVVCLPTQKIRVIIPQKLIFKNYNYTSQNFIFSIQKKI